MKIGSQYLRKYEMYEIFSVGEDVIQNLTFRFKVPEIFFFKGCYKYVGCDQLSLCLKI